tara:strand:- start:42 stop:974 length:933 start_codon:yes stop_codon:yes gene_type:complete
MKKFNETEGQNTYNLLLHKLELDDNFITNCFYIPFEILKTDLTVRKKTTLSERLDGIYSIHSNFRNDIREDLIQTEGDSDPELYSLGGFPCNKCSRTRKQYFEGLKQLNHPNNSSRYQTGIQVCTCVKIIDSLLNYKLVKDQLIETKNFWQFARNNERFNDKGSIKFMIVNREEVPNFYQILKDTIFDMTGERMEKLSELKNNTYPKNRDGKPIIQIFKELFHLKYEKSLLDKTIKNCYEEQLDYVDKYCNAKIKYILDKEAQIPVHRPIQHRKMSYDTKMKLDKVIGSTNKAFRSNNTPNKESGEEYAI